MLSSEDILKIVITGTLFIVILCGFIVLLIKLFDKTRRNFELEKDNISKDHQTQLLQTQLEIQEQTLNNISQEIHDNIGQVLSFVKLSINAINMNEMDAAKAKLAQSKDLITKAIQDLRNLSKTLNTSYISDVGLARTIETQLLLLTKTGVYETKFYASEMSYNFPSNTEIVLFRVVQELLNNIVKHAEATKIKVLLDYQDDKLTIDITDNGKGFIQSAETAQRSGLGLKNICSRISMIGGTMNISSELGKGTNVCIQISKPAASKIPPADYGLS